MHDHGASLPWERYGLKLRVLARETVIGLLSGIGVGETRRERTGEIVHVLHARRRLSERELTLLTPEWCALTAVGIAGGGVPW